VPAGPMASRPSEDPEEERDRQFPLKASLGCTGFRPVSALSQVPRQIGRSTALKTMMKQMVANVSHAAPPDARPPFPPYFQTGNHTSAWPLEDA
jgi:hypothetical protein